MYPGLNGKCRMGSCLPFTASCSVGRSSFYIWPRSGKLGLVGRLKFDRTFLDWHRDIYDFNLLFPNWRINTCMLIPSFLLLIPLKDGRPVLFLGICQHRLGRQEKSRVRRDNHTKSLRRNERETVTTYQLLLKRGHYGLPVSMHSRSAKASLSEPGTVTALKRRLQKSKAVCRRKCLTEVGDSMRKERSSGMS